MTYLDDQQKAALCGAIRSSRYAKKIVSLLRDVSADLYKTDKPHGFSALENVLDGELLEVFKQIFNGVDENNPMEMEARIKEVIDFMKQTEEISFTVPVHPSADFLKRLHGWCADNIDPKILLDFTTNRLMESGLLMVYKGHYFVYSLENLLDEYFSSKDLGKYFDKQA